MSNATDSGQSKCQVCQAAIVIRSASNPRRYCSGGCRKAAYRLRHGQDRDSYRHLLEVESRPPKCHVPDCLKPAQEARRHGKWRKYCSEACRARAARLRKTDRWPQPPSLYQQIEHGIQLAMRVLPNDPTQQLVFFDKIAVEDVRNALGYELPVPDGSIETALSVHRVALQSEVTPQVFESQPNAALDSRTIESLRLALQRGTFEFMSSRQRQDALDALGGDEWPW